MAKIFYTEVNDFLRKEERFKILKNHDNIYNVNWSELTPDQNNTWLTEGMQDDWETFIPIGNKESKAGNKNVLFWIYTRGIGTSRDPWAYNHNYNTIIHKMESLINIYNEHVHRYHNLIIKSNIDDFVLNDYTKISWSNSTKNALLKGKYVEFKIEKIRNSIYRPYNNQFLFFDKTLNNEGNIFYKIFPTPESEKENLVICLSGVGSSKPFHCLMVNLIPDLHLTGDTQCFPYYTYNEDSTGRRENISDWGLKQFREHYRDESITKWDIFYYIYGALHKPEYRTKYAANLRRSLPRIPFYEDFRKYSEAGRLLAELHTNYEQQPVYPLTLIEAKDKPLDWKVKKMKLSKDRQTLVYNDFLTLTGIPPETWEYKLGNRSALDWIIDQYQVTTDKRSGIVNDPNREDEPDYIVRLIGRIVTVSIETVRIVSELEGRHIINNNFNC